MGSPLASLVAIFPKRVDRVIVYVTQYIVIILGETVVTVGEWCKSPRTPGNATKIHRLNNNTRWSAYIAVKA